MRFQVTTFFKVLGVGTFLLIFTLALQAGPAPDAGAIFSSKSAQCATAPTARDMPRSKLRLHRPQGSSFPDG